MKKLLGLMMLFSILSCSTEELGVEKSGGLTANVPVRLNNSLSTTTGKSIKRGILYVELNFLSLIIYSNTGGPSTIIKFDIVANDDVNADDAIVLKNIQPGNKIAFQALGNGDLMPNSIVYTGNSLKERFVKVDSRSAQEVFDEANAKVPYLKWDTGLVYKDVVSGNNSELVLDLKPITGRKIIIYELSDELKSLGYTASITSNYDPTVILSQNNTVLSFDDDATESISGDNIIIYDNNNEKVLEYFYKPTIIAGESTNIIVTITSDKIPVKNTINTSLFVPVFKSTEPIRINN
ncbi:hypothetical protein [Flavobacterium sp. C3NV]|uniref:hypothetical protein n=1 Tax=Flavobacterium sp. C3NV TaxID=3393358 RepID=UPI00398F9AAF